MSQTIPKVVADFETQLSAGVSAGATTASIQSNTDEDSVSLPAGLYAFTIDSNKRSVKEYFIGSLSGTSITSITSISRQGAATSGFARAHKVGASVKITDWAILYRMFAVLTGATGLDAGSPLGYDDAPASLTGNQLATVAYVLSVVNGGTVDFSEQSLSNQTSGEALAINDYVYFKESDAKWYKVDADDTTTFLNVKKGFCKTTAAGASVTIQISISGPVSGFSGLTAGSKYYASSTGGAISTTSSSQLAGRALSTTVLWVEAEDAKAESDIYSTIGMVSPFAVSSTPSGWLPCDGAAVSRTTYARLFSALNPTIGTVTISIATPGVVTYNTHGLATGDSIYLTTTGALPTGLSVNTRYWVIKNDANTFWLATSLANALAGTKINTSGSQSGTHTATKTPYGIGDGSTTFNVPSLAGVVPVGRNQSDTEFAGLGQTGGAKTHTLTTAEIPAHAHDFQGGGVLSGSPDTNETPPAGGSSTTVTNYTSTANAGGGGAHNNIQPYITLNYFIKF